MSLALLDSCSNIADLAGREIIRFYKQDAHEVSLKEDNSFLTAADLAANRIILEELRSLTPGIPVISEEDPAERESHDIFWLVDPLDGTREFLKRNGEFTVNIALIERGAPVLGVIVAPALGVAYMGGVGLGARKRIGHGAWSAINVCASMPTAPRMVVSRSHESAELTAWISSHCSNVKILAIGSSLKFCLIAEGNADFYPRFGDTMEWDTAAGQAILVAAGGTMKTIEGLDLVYGKREFKNPYFLAAGGHKIKGLADYYLP